MGSVVLTREQTATGPAVGDHESADSSLKTASVLSKAQRLVIKVGSSLVTNEGRGIDAQAIATWAAEIAALRALGREILVVSSGAVAEGMKRLSWS